MESLGASTPIDALLLPYIRAADEADSQLLLERLVSEHVGPVIRQVIRSKLRVYFDRRGRALQDPDAEDLYSQALVLLLARLKESKTSANQAGIGNLRSYVAVVAY